MPESSLPSTEIDRPTVALTVVTLFIALSVSVTVYYTGSLYAAAHPDNVLAFTSFSGTLSEYAGLRREWRTRLFSNYLAGRIVDPRMTRGAFCAAVGAWTAGWFFLCFTTYLLADPRKALFLIFGTFAAMAYAFTPLSELHVYPWDMPALFGFLLLALANRSRNITALAATLILGVGFKETLLLGALLPLFWKELSWNGRIVRVLTMIVAAGAVKLAIDLITGNPSPLFTMSLDNFGLIRDIAATHRGLWYNVHALSALYLNHPIFINAGTLVVFLLLPVRDRDDLAWKVIGLLFCAGVFLFGVINESRVFFELIPISLWTIFTHAERWYRSC